MTHKTPHPGWKPVALRSSASGEWMALPNAAWTPDEAYRARVQGAAEVRIQKRNGKEVLEVRAV